MPVCVCSMFLMTTWCGGLLCFQLWLVVDSLWQAAKSKIQSSTDCSVISVTNGGCMVTSDDGDSPGRKQLTEHA